MRINLFVAKATGMSRRAADDAVAAGRVLCNGERAATGAQATAGDVVTLDGQRLLLPHETITIIFNKPAGYICSRNGQGGQTVYELLPKEFQQLKTVGRLDKDSSGLLLLTNDGELAHRLTHPSFQKTKIYEVTLNKPLTALHRQMIADMGVLLRDGPSRLQLERLPDGGERKWRVTMHEGRNRQIRRTFAALGYDVIQLHRTNFGLYGLGTLKPGDFQRLD